MMNFLLLLLLFLLIFTSNPIIFIIYLQIERNWPQTIERTYQWNQGVKEMIEENDYLLEMTTFVDLFQASIIVPHLKDDHIHKVGKLPQLVVSMVPKMQRS